MFPISTLRSTYATAADTSSSFLFPLAGGFKGLIGLGAYWLGTILFPPPHLPVLLSMAAVATLTLARPESGFAAYTGGDRPDASAVSSGAVWLVLLLLARFFAVQALFANEAFGLSVALKYVMAHSLSQLMAASVSWAQSGDASPTASTPSIAGRALAIAVGVLPMLALVGLTTLWIYALFVIPILLLRWWLLRQIRRQAGGNSSRYRGAVQQLSELIVYLSFVSLLWISV